ncbi:MAG: HIT family protein [Alphaproteobacteria bacterium]|nr:HIT family protein [Alphaproteobacteria bacterium]MBV9694703.1 HIT family protein [Alphaproteobacteria bacterium]
MKDFALHPQLAADTVFVADWALSRVLLMDDARYPWLVLVPRVDGAVEMFELDAAQYSLLTEEIARAASGLKAFTGCVKINIAALGNLVPQLHIHIVARNPGDAAWPGTVWGKGAALRHEAQALQALTARLRDALRRAAGPG